MKYLVPVAVIALIVISAVFFFNQNTTQTQSAQDTLSPSAPQQETVSQTQPTQAQENTNTYTDGTYEAEGNYVSPGGPRTIDLSITLEKGIITDSSFVGTATDPTSIRFQGEFGDGYQAMIIGKNIDEVALTKVAGSSLTPKGFTDALTKIKEEAKS